MPEQENSETKVKKKWWIEHPFALNFILFFAIALVIKFFCFDLYYIPTPSMEPTIKGQATSSDRVLVNKLAYVLNEPQKGDIVVFTGPNTWIPENAGTTLIKRIIAGPGDTVSCCNSKGQLLVNDQPISEPYVKYNFRFEPGVLDCTTETRSRRCFPEQKIPAGQYWVMGDNRENSADSSFGCTKNGCQGPISEENIIGQMKTAIWLFGL